MSLELRRQSQMFGELCTDKAVAKDECVEEEWALAGQHYVAYASLVVLVLGMLLQGVAKGPRFSFSATYVDNNTEQVNTGYYTGIMITCSVLGPVLAFLLGGFFSQIYVTLGETELDPKHPRWIGAWWLGYLVLGFVTISVSIPLLFFPRRLPKPSGQGLTSPNSSHHCKDDKKPLLGAKPHHPPKNLTLTSLTEKILFQVREFVQCQLRLCKNPVYMLLNACGTFILFGVSSQSFMAKYLERVFDLPAYQANYTMAFKSLLATGIGTYGGGYLTRRFKMEAKGALNFTLVALLASVVVTCAGFVLYCNQGNVHNMPGDWNPACVRHCQCSEHSYFPICGQDGLTYYSPCQAGCEQVFINESTSVYSRCSCIKGGSALTGLCPYGCSHLYSYVLFSALLALLQTLTTVPRVVIFLRCVDASDKTAALGFQSFTNSLLGYLCGEILFGFLIDGTCSVWDESCGVRGRCLQYDNDLLRVKLHGYVFTSNLLSFLCVVGAYYYATRTRCFDEEALEKQS